MLFSSAVFILAFLPVTLLGFHFLGRAGQRAEFVWLSTASLFFYAYWNPLYLLVLLGSVLINHTLSRRIAAARDRPNGSFWLPLSITANLLLLFWYKYLFSVLSFVHGLGGPTPPEWAHVLLPLGISFFTFTQIAYLVDLSQGAAEPENLLSYTFFVTFFPHLIAGPILHHSEIMPQIRARKPGGLDSGDLALGATWFVMGLSKKVLIADSVGVIADGFYRQPAAAGAVASWVGVVAYAVQLYFDFSGYSDMAMGLARMFSIRFPLNFNSPFKTYNIIDFWSHFHMTLTRYLTAYLYNPISLRINRWRIAKGKTVSRRALKTLGGFTQLVATPTIITFGLAGIWHGAGIQFFLFGLLHGLYLTINHAWRIFTADRPSLHRLVPKPAGYVLTAGAVLFSWIFFRAANMADASTTIAGLLHRHGGLGLGAFLVGLKPLDASWKALLFLAIALLAAWFMPNTQQILGQDPQDNRRADAAHRPRAVLFRPNLIWGTATGLLLTLCIFKVAVGHTPPFLYFQF